MKAVLCMLAVICAVALSSPKLPTESVSEADLKDWDDFHFFQREHVRLYGDLEEKLLRFKNFQANQRRAEQLTAEHNGLAEFGITQFSDLSAEEFRDEILSGVNETLVQDARLKAKLFDADAHMKVHGTAPAAMDWRTTGKVSAVRNQAQCGCCWAFSAAAELECQWLIHKTGSVVLSTQQMVDCDSVDHGCNGGFYTNAWSYIYRNGGLQLDSTYPYAGVGGTCKYSSTSPGKVALNNGGATNAGTTFAAIQTFVSAHGPSSAALDATLLQTYKSGVLTSTNCPNLNHAVLIVGYSGTQNYFSVKNSWGTGWGESGFFRINPSSCLISTQVYGSGGVK